jgi:hypothetical protein
VVLVLWVVGCCRRKLWGSFFFCCKPRDIEEAEGVLFSVVLWWIFLAQKNSLQIFDVVGRRRKRRRRRTRRTRRTGRDSC